MAEDTASREALRRGHEYTDVNVRAIIWTGVGVALAIVFSALIAYAWIVFSSPSHQLIAVSKRPSTQMLEQQPPPSRGLPGTEMDNSRVLTRRQEAKLSGYRWMNKRADVVSIPIERAMQMIAKSGLPDFARRSAEQARGGQ